MKIIHTADLHLGSALTARMTRDKARARGDELLGTLARLIGEARRVGASAMIIAGDLFDTKSVSPRLAEYTAALIGNAKDIAFFILEGNHDVGTLERAGIKGLPNVYTFGGSIWTCYDLAEGITIGGTAAVGKGAFNSCDFESSRINIAILHGDLRDSASGDEYIDAKEAIGKSIDYVALGHYHSYRHARLDRRTLAVYSGTPEGRGFDECGEKGYSLIEAGYGNITHRFVPFARRRLKILKLPLDGIETATELMTEARALLSQESAEDLIRLELTGRYRLGLRRDASALEAMLSEGRYYLEVKDSSAPLVDPEAFTLDRSLKGEFVRTVLAEETLTEEIKGKILALGIAALNGDTLEG